MACNCKRAMVLENEHGIKEEETIVGKLYRYMLKATIFIIVFMMGCILAPIIMFIVIYKIAFKDNMTIVLPKFLGKYME